MGIPKFMAWYDMNMIWMSDECRFRVPNGDVFGGFLRHRHMQPSHARLLPVWAEGFGTAYGDRSLPFAISSYQLLSIFKSSMLRLENHSQPLATRDSCNSARPVKLRFHTCPEGFKMKSGDVDHGGILGDPETKQMGHLGRGWLNSAIRRKTNSKVWQKFL